MRIFNNLNDLPDFRNAVVTIGSFDGVHSGHQMIFKKVNSLAKKIGGESIVITFHPHPRQVIFPNDDSLRLITTIDEKVKLFERYDIDNVIVVPFTVEFSQQSADEYIEKFLVGKFQPKHIVIGYDHRFGKNRIGDINYLKWHGKALDYEVLEIEKQDVESIVVSSTKVRNALETGMVADAAKLLGHRFTLTGQVEHGQHIGATIGYPTANLKVSQKHKLIPADGAYAVFVNHRETRYSGMLYIGKRPSLDDSNKRTIEVNIFDFHKDIYNDKLTLEFVGYVRGDTKFDGLDALKAQLSKDKENSKLILQKIIEQEAEKKKLILPSVAVVILNYNGWDFLEKYLPGVLKTDYPNLQVILADNGSSDDSIEKTKANFPNVHVLDLKTNYGFAEGYNQALQNVEADYFVLLNSDVEVTDNWIKPIIEQMEEDSTVAAAQPKIKAVFNKNSFEYSGAAGGMIDKWGYPLSRGRVFQSLELDKGQFETKKEIFWASGAALFIRSELFHQIGGFDGEHFAHMEEIDLCWRLKRAGFKVMYYPDAEVFHVGGGTLNYQSPNKTYLNFRNSYFTILKNEKRRKLLWLIPLRLILDGVAGAVFLLKGQPAHTKSIVKAHWDFFPKIKHLLRRRKHFSELVQKISIGKPNQTGLVNKSIIWSYYVAGKKTFKEL